MLSGHGRQSSRRTGRATAPSPHVRDLSPTPFSRRPTDPLIANLECDSISSYSTIEGAYLPGERLDAIGLRCTNLALPNHRRSRGSSCQTRRAGRGTSILRCCSTANDRRQRRRQPTEAYGQTLQHNSYNTLLPHRVERVKLSVRWTRRGVEEGRARSRFRRSAATDGHTDALRDSAPNFRLGWAMCTPSPLCVAPPPPSSSSGSCINTICPRTGTEQLSGLSTGGVWFGALEFTGLSVTEVQELGQSASAEESAGRSGSPGRDQMFPRLLLGASASGSPVRTAESAATAVARRRPPTPTLPHPRASSLTHD
ncbi:hypothetical protein AAFF_G00435440 [Aldrovandia affinis]|uniref:Uncharacterized protein n=1 Tax=Aldrovandia affinis TaxID=143900 RepID=A0AAD7S8D8_9TELE|nr:hypothetical protein AAFF_G00435440 [Aldrovandia affinis]